MSDEEIHRKVVSPTGNDLVDGKTAQQWADSYAGLKGHTEKKTRELDGVNSRYAETLSKAEADRSELESIKKRLVEMEEASSAKILESELRFAKLAQRDALGKLIAENHPALIPFHMQGFVNPENKTGEELTAYLSGLTSMLTAMKQNTLEGFRQGVVPQPPNPAQVPAQASVSRGVNAISSDLRTAPVGSDRYKELLIEYEMAKRDGTL